MDKNYNKIPFVFSVLICFIIYYSHLDISIVNNNNILSSTLRDFIPQGWGFFTRNCKEYQFDYYLNGHKIDLNIGNVKDLLGIKRTARYKARELSFLTSLSTDKINWRNNLDSCELYSISVDKYKINSIDTGIYTIVKFKPIPWAWYSVTNQYENPKKFLKVNLKYK